MKYHLLIPALAFLLSACGGGSSSSGQQPIPLRIESLDGVGYVVPGQETVDPTLAQTLPGIRRVGMVADGVSRLLVRAFTNEPGTVEFGFLPGPTNSSEFGELSIPGRNDRVMQTVVEPVSGQPMAFCVHRAPTNFVRATHRAVDESRVEREISLEVVFTPDSGAAATTAVYSVRLRRPPVVLSHGLWSSPETWQGDFLPLAQNQLPRFLTQTLDYRLTTHLKFADNMVLVASGIQGALKQARDLGFAATQVDWVGHSLGGVLPRFYYRMGVDRIDGFEWSRSDNFGAGDIHKLIVLNSPQWGSTWGNLIESYRNSSPVIQYLAQFLVPIGGAIEGMRVGSPEMGLIGATGIPAHSLGSVGAEDLLQGTSELIDVVGLLPSAYAETYGRILQAIDLVAKPKTSELYFGLKHDLAVHEASQQAGLEPAFRTDFTGFSYNHLMVTSDRDYLLRVVELLNAGVEERFQMLPAPELTLPLTAGGSVDLRPPVEGALTMSSPLPGPHVVPGQTLRFTLAAREGFVPRRVTLLTSAGTYPVRWEGTRGAVSVQVPATASGSFRGLGVAVDAADRVSWTEPFHCSVQVSSPVTELRCGVPELRFSGRQQSASLPVRAVHADGVERPAHGAAAGTVYRIENPEIASVSASGQVRPRASGRTRLWIQNGDATVSIAIRVALRED